MYAGGIMKVEVNVISPGRRLIRLLTFAEAYII